MSLPSKYAPGGLSREDQSRTITVGRRSAPRPTNYIARIIEEKIQDAVETNTKKQTHDASSQDYEMVPMDDFNQVDMLSQYVSYSRQFIPETPDLEIVEDSPDVPGQYSGNTSFLVVDTNFILSHLNILNDLKTIGASYGLVIVIPTMLIKELDGLKESKRTSEGENGLSGKSVGHLARWANDWIYEAMADPTSIVRGQKLHEKLNKTAVKDDAILDCCLYFQKNHPNTLQVLMSNDKNLCAKALANDVLTVSYRSEMTAQLIAEMIHNESLARFGDFPKVNSLRPVSEEPRNINAPPQEIIHIVYREIQMVLLSIIDRCIVSAYGDVSLVRNYDKQAVTTIPDCAEVMKRLWFTVFSDYFSSDFKPFEEPTKGQLVPLWTEMPANQEELRGFVEFWSRVLTILYEAEMDEGQQTSLKQLIERWHQVLTV